MKKKKRKISFLKILIVFLLIYLFIVGGYKLITINIKNIYVIGNNYIKDKYIIEKAGLTNYPPFFLTTRSSIKRKLLNYDEILNVNVKKKLFSVYLYVDENIPLFYNKNSNKIVLKNGKEIDDKYNVAVLNNYVPDTIYNDFINSMGNVNQDILDRISEINYVPNDVDSKRFYLIMDDGNSVYVTLDDFLKINNYIEIIKTLDNNKGTIYLDSGNYFEIKNAESWLLGLNIVLLY